MENVKPGKYKIWKMGNLKMENWKIGILAIVAIRVSKSVMSVPD